MIMIEIKRHIYMIYFLFSVGCFTFMTHGHWRARDHFKIYAAIESAFGYVMLAIFIAALTKQLGLT